MQVVLLEDVKALGKKGQIVNVNDGYARNFILPKKLGVEANSKNLNDLKLKKANDDRIAAEQLAAARELGAKLDESSVTLTIKAGEGGRAFGSVSSKEIAKAIGLVRACELIGAGELKPALVIGVPVGFVNVVESKELLLTLDVPYIVARGRKGGSNVAAAICNAMLYQASNNARE